MFWIVKSDGVVDSLRVDLSEGGSVDSVRDKCVIMIYDVLVLDSMVGMFGIFCFVVVVFLYFVVVFYNWMIEWLM